RGRRRGGGGRGGVSARPLPRANPKARRRRRAFVMPAGRAKGALTSSRTRRKPPKKCPGAAIITLGLQRRGSHIRGVGSAGGYAGAVLGYQQKRAGVPCHSGRGRHGRSGRGL